MPPTLGLLLLTLSLCLAGTRATGAGEEADPAFLQSEPPEADPQLLGEVAAWQVLNRLIPTHSARFHLSLKPASRFTDAPGGAPANPDLDNFARVPTPRDYFAVAALQDVVYIEGTSPVALTQGAYFYIKHVTHGQMTWGLNGTGDQLKLPERLPDLCSLAIPPSFNSSATAVAVRAAVAQCWVRHTSTVSFRYAWNMCTFSYSAAFWSAQRWQREIDWMAMHGVNFPLALTGQEYVWMVLFHDEYNVTLDRLQSWFSGPAFLAWQRAGNIRGFAGPLSLHWIEGQMELQKTILRQMRAMGMTPILPCFAGHVPSVARDIWPNARFTQSDPWNHFEANETDVWYIDPTDPAFTEIGQKFTAKLVEVFGTDHFYSCDTFNEVDPAESTEPYLKAAAAAVLDSITAVDPTGVWVLQAWLFHFQFWTADRRRVQYYLSGVPNNAMVILDLNSEEGPLAPQFGNYHGKPWVWNLLHNYGGVRGMYGHLSVVAQQPFTVLQSAAMTRARTKQIGMVGIGFTPEAIEQNPIMYELLTDTFFHAYASAQDDPPANGIDTQRWLEGYVAQRYNLHAIADVDMAASSTASSDASASASAASTQGLAHSASPCVQSFLSAWKHLFRAVYDQNGHPRAELEFQPQWWQDAFGWANGDPTHMMEAVEPLLLAIGSLPSKEDLATGGMLYDLVDVVRQASTMFFSDLHRGYSSQAWKFLQSNWAGENGQYFTGAKQSPSGLTGQPPRSLRRLGAHMLAVIHALDALFATNANFLLGTWVEDAVQWADPAGPTSSARQTSVRRMLFNAKNQLTMWGPAAQINDYAAKAWAGLYRDYYAERWRLMMAGMLETVEAPTAPPTADGDEQEPLRWRQDAFERELLAFEEQWVSRPTRYRSHPTYPFVPGKKAAAVDGALKHAARVVRLVSPCGTNPPRQEPKVGLFGEVVGVPTVSCTFTDWSDSSLLPKDPQASSSNSSRKPVVRSVRVVFEIHPHKSLLGQSYMYGQRVQSVGQRMLLCALQDDCVGFTSQGPLVQCSSVLPDACPSTDGTTFLKDRLGVDAYVKVSSEVTGEHAEDEDGDDDDTGLSGNGSGDDGSEPGAPPPPPRRGTETNYASRTVSPTEEPDDTEGTTTNSSHAEDAEHTTTTTLYEPLEFTSTNTSHDDAEEATGTATLQNNATATLSPAEDFRGGGYTATRTPGDGGGNTPAGRNGGRSAASHEEGLRIVLICFLIVAVGALVFAYARVKMRRASLGSDGRPVPGVAGGYQRTAQREGDEAETATLADGVDDEDDDDDGTMEILPHPHSTRPPVAFSVAARKAISLVEARQGLPHPPSSPAAPQAVAVPTGQTGDLASPPASSRHSSSAIQDAGVEMTDWQTSPPNAA